MYVHDHQDATRSMAVGTGNSHLATNLSNIVGNVVDCNDASLFYHRGGSDVVSSHATVKYT